MSFSNFRINQPAPFEPETDLQEGMTLWKKGNDFLITQN
jgi:hypothetical protein